MQERLKKWRRVTGADALLKLPMEEMRTCQCRQLKLLLIKTLDCSRWVPSSKNRKVSSWECHWKRHHIAADECPSVWKIGSWDYHWMRQQILGMRDRLAAETTEEMLSSNVTEQDTGNNRLFSRHCLFFSSFPYKPRTNPMQAWLHWIYQC